MAHKLISTLDLSAKLALCLGTFSVIGYSIALGSLSVLVTYFACGICGIMLSWRCERVAVNIFLVSYGAACIFSVILYYVYLNRYGVPYFDGGSDDYIYEQDAVQIYKIISIYDSSQIRELIGKPFHNSTGYVYLLTLLMYAGDVLGGYDTMMARLFNASLLGVLSILVYRTARLLELGAISSISAAMWVSLFPMMIYVSGHVFRDALTALLIFVVLYCAVRVSRSERGRTFGNIGYSLLSLAAVLFIIELRLLYAIPTILMLVSAWFVKIRQSCQPGLRYLLLSSMLVVAAVLIGGNLDIIQIGFKTIGVYDEMLADGSQAGKGGLSILLFSMPEPWQTFGRLLYAIATPLPIFHSDFEKNLLSVGTLVQIYLASFVFLGLKYAYRDLRNLPLIVGFAILFYSYMMGSFTFRHITQWFPFAVLICAIGYKRYRAYRFGVYLTCTVLIALSGALYIFAKHS